MVKAKKDMVFGFVAFALLLVVVGGVAVMYSRQAISDIAMEPTSTATTIPILVSPSPMLVAPTFAVFNGSGVAGAAAKVATKVEGLGYEVKSTGNAAAAQTGTTISISRSIGAQKDKLVEELKGVGIEGKALVLEDDLEYSVKIIIGK
jgi:hypothetical protein